MQLLRCQVQWGPTRRTWGSGPDVYGEGMGPVLRRLDGRIVATDLRRLADGRWRVVAWYATRKVAVFWTRDQHRAYGIHADAELVRWDGLG